MDELGRERKVFVSLKKWFLENEFVRQGDMLNMDINHRDVADDISVLVEDSRALLIKVPPGSSDFLRECIERGHRLVLVGYFGNWGDYIRSFCLTYHDWRDGWCPKCAPVLDDIDGFIATK